jgi:hypothetical protein
MGTNHSSPSSCSKVALGKTDDVKGEHEQRELNPIHIVVSRR